MLRNPYDESAAAGPSRKPVYDLPALEKTSKLLQDHFTQDARSVPELKELISGAASAPASYVPQLETPWELYRQKNLSPIPEALFNHFQSSTTQSYLGLFPELERAWITVDDKLFLWDYVHGEFDSFTDQTEVITSVSLVKPKQGVFVDEIQHLMVVCTTGSLILIGIAVVSIPDSPDSVRKSLKLYATDMTVSTKSLSMSSIVGTDAGRIFMTGSDDCLYELEYSSTESWFSAKVSLKNHSVSFTSSFLPSFLNAATDTRIHIIVVDNFRHSLYTVSSAHTITIYYLGSTGLDPNVTARATLRDISRHAQNMAPSVGGLDTRTFEIIGLHVVSPQESQSDVHAVAVTSKGIRLYLTHKGSPYGYGYPTFGSSNASNQPTDLRLLHVRVPPSNLIHPSESLQSTQFTMNAAPQPLNARTFQISSITSTLYSSGLFLASQPPPSTEENPSAVIACTFPDASTISSLKVVTPQQTTYGAQSMPPYQRPMLTENIKLLQIPGDTWAIAELPRSAVAASVSHNPVAFNELATQFTEPQREFLVLTNVGVVPFVKLRPVDVLHNLILHDQRFDLEHFCKSFGRDQTCAMLYAILAKNWYIVSESSPPEHGFRHSSRLDVGMNARQILFALSGKPTVNASQIVDFSGRLHGLTLYVARLVRPIWNAGVAKADPQGHLVLSLPDEVLVRTRHNLQLLRELYEGDPFLFQAPPGDHRSAGMQDEAWKAELTSASHLTALVSQTVEAISFILLLHDLNLDDIASRCDKNDQQRLATIIFADLITTHHGRELARVLVNAVINQQISQQVNVDTISEVLQQRCGSFCSTDDVMLYKAEENIRRAADSRNSAERTQALLESLKLYSKGCKNITPDKLQAVVTEYRRLRYAKGAVELPLRCAQEWDIDKAGQDYWLAGCPAQDPRVEAYNTRLQCYDLVLGSLQTFDDFVASAKGSLGRDVVVDDSQLVSQSAYRAALGSTDAIFHSTLYDWLIERGSADELLEIDTPFLESHLQREPLTLQNGELLWQYYVKSGQHLKAAETLQGLAESSRFALTLERRIECLTLAVANAKSHPTTGNGPQETAITFLTDLEEKLEVAQSQLQILEALQHEFSRPDDFVRVKIQGLSNGLRTVTELYEDYVEPLNMPEMKLLLLHVSEHEDQNLVISIWRYLFDRLGTAETLEDEFQAVSNLVERLGRRFYPSPSSFPTDYIAKTMEDMTIRNRDHVPSGWAPRVLRRAKVPYQVIFDLLSQMYESQIPPYNLQKNVQALSADMAIVLSDWLDEATSPRMGSGRSDFPAGALSRRVDTLLREVSTANVENKKLYEEIKSRIRREF